MIIKKKSPFSGIVHEMDLPITQAQVDAWQAGEYAQVAFSNLTARQREFIMTGITEQEWNDTFPEEDEEDEEDLFDAE